MVSKTNYLLLTCLLATAFADKPAQKSIATVFHLYQQEPSNVYTVYYLDARGTERRYRLAGAKPGVVWNVFFDAISQNFYCVDGSEITIIQMTAEFTLVYHEKQPAIKK